MEKTALTTLRNYIYEALTPSDIQWLGAELTAYAQSKWENLPPYTMTEINAMIDESERQSAHGEVSESEDMFRRLDATFREAV